MVPGAVENCLFASFGGVCGALGLRGGCGPFACGGCVVAPGGWRTSLFASVRGICDVLGLIGACGPAPCSGCVVAPGVVSKVLFGRLLNPGAGFFAETATGLVLGLSCLNSTFDGGRLTSFAGTSLLVILGGGSDTLVLGAATLVVCKVSLTMPALTLPGCMPAPVSNLLGLMLAMALACGLT